MLLQFVIQLLQHPGLAVQIDGYTDLRSKDVGHYRNGDVINRSAAVSLDLVRIGQMNTGDEDDRSLLKARMLANDISELKAVKVRHADVHQDHGYVVLEQDAQRFAR